MCLRVTDDSHVLTCFVLQVAKLEHAWGIEQRKFDLDTKHNVLHCVCIQ